MRLGNLAVRARDLDGLADFFGSAPGCAVRGRRSLDGDEFVELELAGVTVNAFHTALYEGREGPVPADGWLHVSFLVDDLDELLEDVRWGSALLWGPHVISGDFGRRRIAFFEPSPGVRIELMQQLQDDSREPGMAELAGAGSTTVYEAAGQQGAMDPEIRALGPGRAIAGRALTVRCTPGDNLGVHQAIAAAEAGDVLVVDGGGAEVGYLGDVLAVAAQTRGVRGAVVAGGVRDLSGLDELGFEAWARGPAITAATKRIEGEVGVPIVCGGVLVRPGDVVVADRDGVAVVPGDNMKDVVDQVRARIRREDDLRAQIRAGALTLDLLGLR